MRKIITMDGSVVIVDDNEDILELLSEYLLLEDFDVVGHSTDGLVEKLVSVLTSVKNTTQYRPDSIGTIS